MTPQALLPFIRDASHEAQFMEFHERNPHVYRLFCRFCDELIASGRTRYSARTILHRIRWHVDTQTDSGDGLKINNNHSPFYARMWASEHPRHSDFFQTRGKALGV